MSPALECIWNRKTPCPCRFRHSTRSLCSLAFRHSLAACALARWYPTMETLAFRHYGCFQFLSLCLHLCIFNMRILPLAVSSIILFPSLHPAIAALHTVRHSGACAYAHCLQHYGLRTSGPCHTGIQSALQLAPAVVRICSMLRNDTRLSLRLRAFVVLSDTCNLPLWHLIDQFHKPTYTYVHLQRSAV